MNQVNPGRSSSRINFKKGAVALALLAGAVPVTASSAEAREQGALLGSPAVSGDESCFEPFSTGVKRTCPGGSNWVIPLIRDTAGGTVTARIAAIAGPGNINKVICQAFAAFPRSTTVRFGTQAITALPGTTEELVVSVEVPVGGAARVLCFMQEGTRLLHLSYNQ